MSDDQLVFAGAPGKVTLAWTFDGDYIVNIQVMIDGFQGNAEGHVIAGAFEHFQRAFSQLAETRDGEAALTSAIPDDFELLVRSTDSLGHMAVSGKLKSATETASQAFQRLEFALDFPPEQLEKLAHALSKNAT